MKKHFRLEPNPNGNGWDLQTSSNRKKWTVRKTGIPYEDVGMIQQHIIRNNHLNLLFDIANKFKKK
jgi:hypothetical protein